jgi:hypothetical protein
MNLRSETVERALPPGNRPAVPRDWTRGVLEQYVAGGACPERSRRNTQGRPEGRTYPRSQQPFRAIFGLGEY